MAVKDDVTNFIAEQHKQTNRVPSIADMISHKVIRNPKQFYKLFPRGLTQACRAANVPIPEIRIRLVRKANAKRKQKMSKSTEPVDSLTPLVTNENATGTLVEGPVSGQLTEQERKALRSGTELQRLQRDDAAMVADENNKRQIQKIKDTEIARRMHQSFANYDRGMRDFYRNHPLLQMSIQRAASKLGWGTDIPGHITELINDQYKVASYIDSTLPEVSRKMGIDFDIPVDPDYAFHGST